jgi:hypothetical protein
LGVPAHEPLVHVSFTVQGFPSSHEPPLRASQCPSWLAPAAIEHTWQAPHGVSQQTELAQLPLWHSAPATQASPFALSEMKLS